jgi:class 3 adenylate cyclase
LKDLGVGLVGHRRTLLDAIAALRGDANAKEPPSEALPHAPASSQASAPPANVAPTAEAVGERRYLIVMFCDLVGSTGISAQLDAEEWRDLVGAYLDAASAAVTEISAQQPPSGRSSRVGVTQISCSPILNRRKRGQAFQPGHGMVNRFMTAQSTVATRRWGGPSL